MSISYNEVETKRCSCCKFDLPLNNFNKVTKCKDGLNCCCKKCEKDRRQEKIYVKGGKAFVLCAGCGSKISAGHYGQLRQPYCLTCIPNVAPAPWSIELKYLAGLIASDGNLGPKRSGCRIGFDNTDANLMKTFLYLIQSPRIATVHDDGVASHNLGHSINIGDRSYYNLFTNAGLMQRKSLRIKEVDLPRGSDGRITDFFLFLRGVFEGDGSVRNIKGRSADMIIGSGSKDFLGWLRKEISTSLDDPEIIQSFSISEPKGKSNIPELYFPTRYVPVLYQKMYLDYDNMELPLPFLQTTVLLKNLGLPYKRTRLEYWAIELKRRSEERKEKDEISAACALKTMAKLYEERDHFPCPFQYDKNMKKLRRRGVDIPSSKIIIRLFGSWSNFEKEYQAAKQC